MSQTMSLSEYKRTLVSEWKTLEFYRDLFAEFVATFMLMTVQCALPADWGKESMGTVVQVSLGMSFVVGATAWVLGDFGGAHMNPAVTFAATLTARITFIRAVFYVGIQCVSSISAAAFINTIHPKNYTGTLAATELHPEMTEWQGVLVEVWLTFMLVLTVLGATNKARKGEIYMPTLIIMLAVGIGVSCGFNSTGGSMNPARTLGPAVVAGIWDHHWIYWVGPLAGSALATLVYCVVLDFVDNPSRRAKKDEDVDNYSMTHVENFKFNKAQRLD